MCTLSFHVHIVDQLTLSFTSPHHFTLSVSLTPSLHPVCSVETPRVPSSALLHIPPILPPNPCFQRRSDWSHWSQLVKELNAKFRRSGESTAVRTQVTEYMNAHLARTPFSMNSTSLPLTDSIRKTLHSSTSISIHDCLQCVLDGDHAGPLREDWNPNAPGNAIALHHTLSSGHVLAYTLPLASQHAGSHPKSSFDLNTQSPDCRL